MRAMSEIKSDERLLQAIKNFDALPDDAVVHTEVTSAVTGLSPRCIRYHPKLPRRYLTKTHYGQRVGDVRALLGGGA
jgi:hypothetical protein